MRTFTRFLSFVAVLAMLAPSAWAQEGNIPLKVKDALLNNSANGREFFIAIPANEKPDHAFKGTEIYVTSSKNTVVTLEAPGLGLTITKPVQAFKITTFNQDDGIGANFEIRDSETPVPYGIRLSADQPISVYVLNPKPVTSEGYLALPTSVWGKENIHCSFYDFGEIKPWGGGFIVIASQNQTIVTITLRGVGFGQTVGKRKIGNTWNVTLNKGDVYMVRGNGATVGSFDLTGSLIKSTKPVGLISFHERTMIPAIANNNGRDHLAEMIPPTSAWGKKFVSAEYKRMDKGDLFRAVAKENNTTVSVIWYDKVKGTVLGKNKWVLQAGKFAQSMYASTSPGGEDIRGYSVWEADKPVLLMQYSYSANWDGASQFDPFMIIVPPLEQYIQGTVFQTPANVAFNTNWFNILAVGDSTDTDHKLLKSVKLDGKFVYQTHPQFLLQRIPTTNIYWMPINLNPGAHRVESETKFAGFIYGFSDFDSYGWPAAMALNKIDELDTLEPELKIVQECSIFKITATEIRNGKIDDNPRQIESGVGNVAMVEDQSFNFKLDPDPASFENDPIVTRYEFSWEVADPTKDARLVYDVIDRAGNVNRDTIDYIADKLSITPNPVDFLKVRVGTSKEMDVLLKNNGVNPVNITKVSMALGANYQVIDPLDAFTLAPSEEKTVKIRYSPTEEYITKKPQYDLDSLIVQTTCTRFPWEVIGRGVMPKIQVGDFDAGTRPVNDKICLDKGLMIANIGTEDLIVNANPTGWTAPFSFVNTTPMLPVTILPGDTIWLKEICFESATVADYTQDITFSSNAMAGDSISNWKGRTTNSELFITNKDWEKRRVGTIHDSVVVLYNIGNVEVQITDIALENPADNNFRITDIKPYDPRNGAVPLGAKGSGRDSIWISVQFQPESLGAKNNPVVAKYTSAKGGEQIEGQLDGIGVLPVIDGNTIDFSNECKEPTEVGETDAQPEVFTVRNTGDMPLTITRIELKNANGNFSWADQPGNLRTDVSAANPLVIQPNDSELFNLTFTPSAVGPLSATIEVDGDTRTGTNAAETHDWEIKGCGFAPGLEFTNITATNLLCDNPVGTLTITNTGGSVVNINSIPTIKDNPAFPGESAFFQIANPEFFPATITPGAAPLEIKVQFLPMEEKTYHAIVVAETDNGPVTMSITWTATRVNAKFTLSNAATPLKLTDQIDVFINGESNSWNQVGANKFEAKLIYNPKEMEYNGTITPGTANQGWTVTPSAPILLADGRHSLTITGTGTTPIQANGTLAKLNMQTFLTTNQLYQMQVEMSLYERNKCVIIDTAGSSVNIEDCFAEGRAVNIGATMFMLRSINPNPATGGTIEVEYSVGFTTPTRIEMYNSLGELVKVISDGVQEAGNYKVRVETEKLSSGIYHFRMVSGPYHTTKSMIISE